MLAILALIICVFSNLRFDVSGDQRKIGRGLEFNDNILSGI